MSSSSIPPSLFMLVPSVESVELSASHAHFLSTSSLRLAVERCGLCFPCSAYKSSGQSALYTVLSVTHELWPTATVPGAGARCKDRGGLRYHFLSAPCYRGWRSTLIVVASRACNFRSPYGTVHLFSVSLCPPIALQWFIRGSSWLGKNKKHTPMLTVLLSFCFLRLCHALFVLLELKIPNTIPPPMQPRLAPPQ